LQLRTRKRFSIVREGGGNSSKVSVGRRNRVRNQFDYLFWGCL